MITSIVFDWGGVLIDRPTPGLLRFFSDYFHISEDTFNTAHKKYVDSFQKGTLTEQLYWDHICTDLLVDTPAASSLWKHAFKSVYRENHAVFNIVKMLHHTGYKTGFLSNTELPAMEFFHERKYDFFNVLIFSCEEGYRKPEKEIYEILLVKLRSKPEETVFIDDRIENIKGAQSLGIHTILFKDANQLKDHLEALPLKIE
jgi:putative hydrolase of the HAD superfamily